MPRGVSRPLLIVGAGTTFGRAFQRACAARGLAYRSVYRRGRDIADRATVASALAQVHPWAVINTAGLLHVDRAEVEPERCWRENVHAVTTLAEECARRKLPLLTFSSDLIFDGRKTSPYKESDTANPLNVLGRCLAEAERELARLWPETLIIRTGAVFGLHDEEHYLTAMIRAIAAQGALAVPNDLTVSPTYAPDLVGASLDLLIDGEHGTWHVVNRGAVTWLEVAQTVALGLGMQEAPIEGRPAATFGWPAPRPAFSALGSERGELLPDLGDALARHLRGWRHSTASGARFAP